MVHSADNT